MSTKLTISQLDGEGIDLTRNRISSIDVRKVSINAGAVRKGSSSGASQLKMQMMAMGSGESIQKVIAADPKGVVESREKEKVALQELNDRFAAYIERVRFLEADNKRLQSIITELTAKFNSLDAALRVIYEEELAAARTALDKTTAAKGAAELRAFNAEAKLKEIMELYTAESAAHVVTKESIPSLEKMISERDSQIDFLTKNLTAVEMELRRLKTQGSSLQQDLALAKQDRDAETVGRVELESIVQTKEDEIVFMKAMYEEKVRALLALDLGSDAFKAAFSNELALALRDIRGEYEAIMEATKTQDTDAWYRAKFNEVMTVTSRQTTDLATAKDEVRNWRNKYHAVCGDFATLRNTVAGLESRIVQLTADLAAAEVAFNAAMAEKDARINALNFEITQMIAALKELTDVKLALDAEIATYRRLLMAEDGRTSGWQTSSAYQTSSSKETTTTTTTTTTTITNPFIVLYAEEDEYYQLAFAYCDADKSGHVTTTELKNAFEWMNTHAFGGRGPRQVSYPYVNAILKRGDIDSSLTLEYPEFCSLMRLEKRLFVENSVAKFAGGLIGLEETVNIFKQAGYVYNENWVPFLKQFQQATGQIAIQQLFPVM